MDVGRNREEIGTVCFVRVKTNTDIYNYLCVRRFTTYPMLWMVCCLYHLLEPQYLSLVARQLFKLSLLEGKKIRNSKGFVIFSLDFNFSILPRGNDSSISACCLSTLRGFQSIRATAGVSTGRSYQIQAVRGINQHTCTEHFPDTALSRARRPRGT